MCNDVCAKYWPPLLATSVHATGKVADGNLGTATRADGSKQVTYYGHPLYYYAGDKKAGDTSGEGLDLSGGKWWLVNPDGEAVTGSGSSSSGNGGYGGY
jgi:predicted lipoprotein with Yx(FWY)xxD motif